MRVILDTNVIIAAFAARGLCESVFELCLDQHEIIVSTHILTEVKNNLQKKLKMPKQAIVQVIFFLEVHSTQMKPQTIPTPICRDPADDRILGLAKSAAPDFIITGDTDLLVLKEFESIPIIRPRQFWEFIKQKEEKE
jgi:putative PIN family toxin of toxin-antitoxin system